jgi:hypothetical protein
LWALAAESVIGFCLRLSSEQAKVYIFQMPDVGKMLVLLGLVITAIGLLLWSGFGRGWLGHLPGDVNYSRGNFSFHFPIVTCLIISAILTLLFWLFRK